TGGRRTTGTRPTSGRSPSRLQPSCKVPDSWRGWTGSGPGRATPRPRRDGREHDIGSLGAALSWLVEQAQLEPAIQLSWATWRFWWLRGYAEELASYVDILAKSEHLPPRQRALALSGTGFGLFASGDQATAQPLLEQSLPLHRQAGDMLG